MKRAGSNSGGNLKMLRQESLAADESKPCFPNEIWLRLLCLMGPTDLGWLERVCWGFQEIILKECWPQFNQLAIKAKDDACVKISCDGCETKPLPHAKAQTLVEKFAKWGSGLQSLQLSAIGDPASQYLHLLAGCISKKISRLVVSIPKWQAILVKKDLEGLAALLSIGAPTVSHLALSVHVVDEDEFDRDWVMEECGELLEGPATACVNLHSLDLDLTTDDEMDIFTPLNNTSGLLRNKPNLKELRYPGGYDLDANDAMIDAQIAVANIMESDAKLEKLAVFDLILFLQAIRWKCQQDPELKDKQPCFQLKELHARNMVNELFDCEIPGDPTMLLTLCPLLEKIVFEKGIHLGTLGDLIASFLTKFHKQPESKKWLVELLEEKIEKTEIKQAVFGRESGVSVECGEEPSQDLIFVKGPATLTLRQKPQG